MSLLQFKDVSFSYGKLSLGSLKSRRKSADSALSSVNLTLTDSKSVSLVGPNGSGKTTLLNLLSGLTSPTSGEIVRQDVDNIAFVSQVDREIGWIPITVEEVLKMSTYRERGFFKKLNAGDFENISSALERMEIQDLSKKQFSLLSVGERQRVRIAQAIAQVPDLLIMDEPFSSLDIPSQERIQKVTQEEKERGAAVVMATHSLEEASQADEVLLMDGRVVAQGEPRVALTEENLRSVYKDRLQILSDNRLLVMDHHDS